MARPKKKRAVMSDSDSNGSSKSSESDKERKKVCEGDSQKNILKEKYIRGVSIYVGFSI